MTDRSDPLDVLEPVTLGREPEEMLLAGHQQMGSIRGGMHQIPRGIATPTIRPVIGASGATPLGLVAPTFLSLHLGVDHSWVDGPFPTLRYRLFDDESVDDIESESMAAKSPPVRYQTQWKRSEPEQILHRVETSRATPAEVPGQSPLDHSPVVQDQSDQPVFRSYPELVSRHETPTSDGFTEAEQADTTTRDDKPATERPDQASTSSPVSVDTEPAHRETATPTETPSELPTEPDRKDGESTVAPTPKTERRPAGGEPTTTPDERAGDPETGPAKTPGTTASGQLIPRRIPGDSVRSRSMPVTVQTAAETPRQSATSVGLSGRLTEEPALTVRQKEMVGSEPQEPDRARTSPREEMGSSRVSSRSEAAEQETSSVSHATGSDTPTSETEADQSPSSGIEGGTAPAASPPESTDTAPVESELLPTEPTAVQQPLPAFAGSVPSPESGTTQIERLVTAPRPGGPSTVAPVFAEKTSGTQPTSPRRTVVQPRPENESSRQRPSVDPEHEQLSPVDDTTGQPDERTRTTTQPQVGIDVPDHAASTGRQTTVEVPVRRSTSPLQRPNLVVHRQQVAASARDEANEQPQGEQQAPARSEQGRDSSAEPANVMDQGVAGPPTERSGTPASVDSPTSGGPMDATPAAVNAADSPGTPPQRPTPALTYRGIGGEQPGQGVDEPAGVTEHRSQPSQRAVPPRRPGAGDDSNERQADHGSGLSQSLSKQSATRRTPLLSFLTPQEDDQPQTSSPPGQASPTTKEALPGEAEPPLSPDSGQSEFGKVLSVIQEDDSSFQTQRKRDMPTMTFQTPQTEMGGQRATRQEATRARESPGPTSPSAPSPRPTRPGQTPNRQRSKREDIGPSRVQRQTESPGKPVENRSQTPQSHTQETAPPAGRETASLYPDLTLKTLAPRVDATRQTRDRTETTSRHRGADRVQRSQETKRSDSISATDLSEVTTPAELDGMVERLYRELERKRRRERERRGL